MQIFVMNANQSRNEYTFKTYSVRFLYGRETDMPALPHFVKRKRTNTRTGTRKYVCMDRNVVVITLY